MAKRERKITDIEEIIKILEKGDIIHLGLCDGDQPYVVPMNYGYTMDDGRLTFYLHGGKNGYKYDVIEKNPKVSFSIETDAQMFTGDLPCKYGMTYSSVLGKGVAEIVSDVDKKEEYLSLFMKTLTGQDFDFNEKLVSVVNIIKITVNEYTGKHRPLPEALR